jgi:hypothetical protein
MKFPLSDEGGTINVEQRGFEVDCGSLAVSRQIFPFLLALASQSGFVLAGPRCIVAPTLLAHAHTRTHARAHAKATSAFLNCFDGQAGTFSFRRKLSRIMSSTFHELNLIFPRCLLHSCMRASVPQGASLLLHLLSVSSPLLRCFVSFRLLCHFESPCRHPTLVWQPCLLPRTHRPLLHIPNLQAYYTRRTKPENSSPVTNLIVEPSVVVLTSSTERKIFADQETIVGRDSSRWSYSTTTSVRQLLLTS